MVDSEAISQGVTPTVIEAAKATVITITEGNEGSSRPATNAWQTGMGEVMRTRTGGPLLRQLIFNWGARGKYTEVKHFEMEVMNFYLNKHCEMSEEEKVPIIKN